MSEVFTTDIDGAKQPDDRLRRSRSAQPTSRMNIENRQPQVPADRPRVYVDRAVEGLPDELVSKVLHDTPRGSTS